MLTSEWSESFTMPFTGWPHPCPACGQRFLQGQAAAWRVRLEERTVRLFHVACAPTPS
jgi:hypothetical protein